MKWKPLKEKLLQYKIKNCVNFKKFSYIKWRILQSDGLPGGWAFIFQPTNKLYPVKKNTHRRNHQILAQQSKIHIAYIECLEGYFLPFLVLPLLFLFFIFPLFPVHWEPAASANRFDSFHKRFSSPIMWLSM